ncbi:required for S-phase initiation or completion [Scheffersomyces amazonensis]|uniref:required for S-phase initiation or completion n=1 Tax=Scheffersomyces amazonensis TaxID=1078765 RepID=UPI00315CAA90
MEDPRYGDPVDSDEELTGDEEADALLDLQKEFELKAQQIKEQYEARRRSDKKNAKLFNDTPPPPPPSAPPVRKVEVGVTPPGTPKKPARVTKQLSMTNHKDYEVEIAKRPVVQASKFAEKLTDMNYQLRARDAMKVDYSERKFSYDDYAAIDRVDLNVNEKDEVSGYKLRKRYITFETLKRTIKKTDPQIKFLKGPKLFAKVNPENKYAEPSYNNWCFMGIVLNKSDTLITKPSETNLKKKGSKYIRLSVGDYRQFVDVYLFGKSFEEYWKLREGSLVYILNPQITRAENSRLGFMLKLDDTSIASILEVGHVQDFGHCKALGCKTAIDTSKDELCDYHRDAQDSSKFKKSSSRRMELNGTAQMRSPQKVKQTFYMGQNTSFIVDSNPLYKTEVGKLDKSKYYDPKILELKNKKRKFEDDKANKVLEKKLLKLGGGSSQLSDLNLFKKTNKQVEEANRTIKEKQKELAFSHTMIHDIGYDPTFSESSLLKSPTRRKQEINRLQELKKISLSMSKERSLEISAEDKRAKFEKWKKNMKELNDYKSNKNNKFEPPKKPNKNSFILSPKRHKNNRIKLDDEDEDSNDSDDDIDIDFSDDKAKQAYERIKGK